MEKKTKKNLHHVVNRILIKPIEILKKKKITLVFKSDHVTSLLQNLQ